MNPELISTIIKTIYNNQNKPQTTPKTKNKKQKKHFLYQIGSDP